MKTHFPYRYRGRRDWFARCWRLGLAVATPCAFLSSSAQEEEDEEPVEFSEWRGGSFDYGAWVHFGGGGAIVDGSEAEFQRRTGIHAGGFGGIEEFHWEEYVGDNGLLLIDGRFLQGSEDYRFKIRWSDEEKGYLGMGFRQYRIYYAGNGGFEPVSGAWLPLADDDLYMDRGEFWVEGGLTRPNLPELSIRYTYDYRNGTKDSTIWGVSSATNNRGVTAAFRDIDEERHIVEGEIAKTFGDTDLKLALRYENADLDNSLNLRQQAGRSNESYITQKDSSDIDLFNVHAFSSTRFNEEVTFNTGYSFTTMYTDISGSRIYGAGYDPVYDPSLARGAGYLDMGGSSQLLQHVVALNVHYLPVKSLAIVPSIRIESQGTEADSAFLQTPSATTTYFSEGSNDYLDFAERLDIRYTGVPNWVFYTRGDWLQGDGNLDERQRELTGNTTTLNRDTDFERWTQKYSIGANWYPARKISISAETYYKIHENDYDNRADSTPNTGTFRYPAYLRAQDFETHDANVRVTWRPVAGIVSVSRYDFQTSEVRTRAEGLSEIASAEIDSHILSQSISWTPISRLYLQATATYVIDSTSTPANKAPSPDGLILESENDYWTGTFAVGYAINARTDLDLEYTYYRADNYVDSSATSQPYGAGFTEHRLMATATQRLTENLRCQLRYGFFTNDDETYGGNLDYDAHLVYGSIQYRF